MKQIQILKTLVVLLVLLMPALLFIVVGPVKGFEQKQQVDFPASAHVFRPSGNGREQLANAVFERSVAKRWSIQFLNALHLYGFGFIDTDRAITGTDQWLFYKPQFEAWDCDRHAKLQEKLERFQFLLELVSAAEIPLIFAHAPNKASIEREYLGGRTARYLNCYFGFENQFAEAVSNLSSKHFVDHSDVLLHGPGEKPSYLKFDSHWTRERGVKAMNQLFESRPGVLGFPMYEPVYKDLPVYTATLTKILLLKHTELIPVPVAAKPNEDEFQDTRLAGNVLFIHDSFYDRIKPYLINRSPNARFLQSGSDIGGSASDSLKQADIVVVEMVQRHFLESVWSRYRLGWGGTFAKWLLDEMAASANECNWEQARSIPERSTVVQGVEKQDGGRITKSQFKTSSNRATLYQLQGDFIPDRLCLRARISLAERTQVKLYFSQKNSAPGAPRFSDAYMVSQKLERGVSSLALVLPESFNGQWVKLEVVDQDAEFVIQNMELAAKGTF